MVSDKFTLDSVKRHEYTFRLNLLHMWQDLKNGEHYLALFYFVLEYITLAKNNDPGRTRNCLNVPF